MSFTRLLSATVSPLKTTLTHRGESSKYRVCAWSTPVSKLNAPVFWLPNGPVPIVRVIVLLSICHSLETRLADLRLLVFIHAQRRKRWRAGPSAFGAKMFHTAVTIRIAGHSGPTS